jgi:general secretion pathway protein D
MCNFSIGMKIHNMFYIFFVFFVFTSFLSISSSSRALQNFVEEENKKGNQKSIFFENSNNNLKDNSNNRSNFENFDSDERAIASINNKSDSREIIIKENDKERSKDRIEAIMWGDWTEPWKMFSDEGAVLLNFANADITNLLKYYEEVYKVIFITDDVLQPIPIGGKSINGSKINYISNKPMSRKEAWNVLMTLLELVGVTLQPGSMNRTYRVVTLAKDSPLSYSKGPLPTYIGVDVKDLPETDMRVRYVYQIKNTNMEAVKNIFKTMQSAASPDPIELKEINSILITDRVYNIKTIMSVINELDSQTMPESMSIIKLKSADAVKIAELYKVLIKEETGGQMGARIIGSKRTDIVTYFDSQLRIIPEPRTNCLIALGSEDSIKRLENFIKDFQDQPSKIPYMPIRTYLLKYTKAEAVASILQQAVGFKGDSVEGKTGGVRNGEKYLSQITIIPEPSTNSLIITAPDDEYNHIYAVLQQIDVEQKQVAVDIILLSVDLAKTKALGSQIRNSPDSLGKNINFQTGVLDPKTGVIGNYDKNKAGVTTGGSNRLLGNLLQLITGSSANPGATVVTLGSDSYGVWGLIRMLMTETQAKILNNPFILITNKYDGEVKVGETRRIAATSITNANNEQQSYTSDDALLEIKLNPQITSDGKIFITLNVSNSLFTGPENNALEAGNKITRTLSTSVLVDDKEMIAIGGLTFDRNMEAQQEVPWLARIPIIGWLFKSKQNNSSKSMLVIFIQPKIIDSEATLKVERDKKINYIEKNVNSSNVDKYCPIKKWYFGGSTEYFKNSSTFKNFWIDTDYSLNFTSMPNNNRKDEALKREAVYA